MFKRIIGEKNVVFYRNDLPNRATHCDQEECGFTIYKGIYVQWDEDQDDRILTLIDQMNAHAQEQLSVCQEHEGVVNFIWRDHVPKRYEVGKMVDVANDCDSWFIDLSITVSQLPRAIRKQSE